MPWWGWLIVLVAAIAGYFTGALCQIAEKGDEIERERLGEK